MTTYASYHNLTTGSPTYQKSSSISSSSSMSSSTTNQKPPKQSLKTRIITALTPIEEPLPPTPFYEPILRRPLFKKGASSSSESSMSNSDLEDRQRRIWEAGRDASQRIQGRRGSEDTLVEKRRTTGEMKKGL